MTTEYLLNREVGHILAALTPQNALIMETVLQTGLRISDVLELRTEQLWLSMWVREKKTGKMHRCGLPKDLLAAILAQAGEVWAFPGTKPGTHKTRQAVWKDVKLAAKAFRLPQNILVLSAGLLVKTSISSSQPVYLLRPGPFTTAENSDCSPLGPASALLLGNIPPKPPAGCGRPESSPASTR